MEPEPPPEDAPVGDVVFPGAGVEPEPPPVALVGLVTFSAGVLPPLVAPVGAELFPHSGAVGSGASLVKEGVLVTALMAPNVEVLLMRLAVETVDPWEAPSVAFEELPGSFVVALGSLEAPTEPLADSGSALKIAA